jgi:hypothetical protein
MSATVTPGDSIPSSFTASVDRPFEPVSVRELSSQTFDRNNQRLSDEQVQNLINNPQMQPDPEERVKRLSAEANAEAVAEFEEEKIYNLSMKELAQRTTTTVHDILDDLVNFNPRDGVRGFIQIFVQSDRLMYIGIIVIVFALLVMLMKSGDKRGSGWGPGEWLHRSGGGGGGCCGGGSRCR